MLGQGNIADELGQGTSWSTAKSNTTLNLAHSSQRDSLVHAAGHTDPQTHRGYRSPSQPVRRRAGSRAGQSIQASRGGRLAKLEGQEAARAGTQVRPSAGLESPCLKDYKLLS